MSRREVVKAGAAAGAAVSIPPALRVASIGSRTVRMVTTSDLRIFEPVFTTANRTADHGTAMYDMLFSLDSKFWPRPQMVVKWSVSGGRKAYAFELRDGLSWHDGAPVTAANCAASIRRRGEGHQIIPMWNV